jgi:hypothetical protein
MLRTLTHWLCLDRRRTKAAGHHLGRLEQLEDRSVPSTLSFAPAVDYPVGNLGVSPNSVAVGDFNGDGKPDLVTANTLDNTVSVLLSHGDGTFAGATDYLVGTSPTSVARGDFNNDGILDVVTGNANFPVPLEGNVSVLLGHGDGTFGSVPKLLRRSFARYSPDTSFLAVFPGPNGPNTMLMLILLRSNSGTLPLLLLLHHL